MKLGMRSSFVVLVLAGVGCGSDPAPEQSPEGSTSTTSVPTSSTSTPGSESSGEAESGSTGATTSSTSTTDDPSEGTGHSCSDDCCRDVVVFAIEDGRETFTLTFELPGFLLEPVVSCPSGTVDEKDAAWTAECNGGEVTIHTQGEFSSININDVRLDDGEPQVFGDELGLSDCDCNCDPVEGNVTVLLDPTGGTGDTGGSSTSGG